MYRNNIYKGMLGTEAVKKLKTNSGGQCEVRIHINTLFDG